MTSAAYYIIIYYHISAITNMASNGSFVRALLEEEIIIELTHFCKISIKLLFCQLQADKSRLLLPQPKEHG